MHATWWADHNYLGEDIQCGAMTRQEAERNRMANESDRELVQSLREAHTLARELRLDLEYTGVCCELLVTNTSGVTRQRIAPGLLRFDSATGEYWVDCDGATLLNRAMALSKRLLAGRGVPDGELRKMAKARLDSLIDALAAPVCVQPEGTRISGECGGKRLWPEPLPGIEVVVPLDLTDLAISAESMLPIEIQSPESVCSVGDSKGGRSDGCQQNSFQARKNIDAIDPPA